MVLWRNARTQIRQNVEFPVHYPNVVSKVVILIAMTNINITV